MAAISTVLNYIVCPTYRANTSKCTKLVALLKKGDNGHVLFATIPLGLFLWEESILGFNYFPL